MSIVQIPLDRLSPTALDALVEELVTREGTDYGEREHSLDEKKRAVLRQLSRGEIVLVFDAASESCNLVPRAGPSALDPEELP